MTVTENLAARFLKTKLLTPLDTKTKMLGGKFCGVASHFTPKS